MKNQEKELQGTDLIVSIMTQQGLEDPNKQVEILEMMSAIIEKEEEWKNLSNVQIENEDDEVGMKQAKTNRLAIRRDRLDAEKFLDSKRSEVQEKMAVFKTEDTVYLKIRQTLSDKAKEYEEELSNKEKYAELLLKEKQDKLLSERTEEISKYCDDPSIYDLGNITDTVYTMILNQLKSQKELEEKAEREKVKAEEEAKQREAKKLEIQKERTKEVSQYFTPLNYSVPDNIAEISDEEFGKLLDEYKNIHSKHLEALKKQEEDNKLFLDRQIELSQYLNPNITLVNGRDELISMSEEEYNVLLTSFKTSKEEYDKEQKELLDAKAALDKKMKEEAEANAKKLEEEKKAKAEAERLAKGPVKDQLEAFINYFTYSELELKDEAGNKVYNDIVTKFEGFKKWALSEISKM